MTRNTRNASPPSEESLPLETRMRLIGYSRNCPEPSAPPSKGNNSLNSPLLDTSSSDEKNEPITDTSLSVKPQRPPGDDSECELENLKKWRFLTIPNMLSILRLAMLAPTIWALVTNRNLLAFILFVVSSLTDAVDGWVARRFHQESEWGKILDPVADKLTINSLGMILAFQGKIPLFLALVVLIRDSIILGGGLLLLTSKTYVPQSNLPGKIAGFVFFAMLCAGLLNARWLLNGFLVPIVTVLILITLVIYAYNFLTKLNELSGEKTYANTGNKRLTR